MKFISYPIIDKFALVHMNNVCANSIQEILGMGYDYQGSLVTARNSNYLQANVSKEQKKKKIEDGKFLHLLTCTSLKSLKSINSVKDLTVQSNISKSTCQLILLTFQL